ncbi:MAG: aminodeoxychorismate synthase component I [Rhodospirillaceae bacterium]|nr:aminodeoxychorismate synthase component I [Rhodospirillaceae bacterium]
MTAPAVLDIADRDPLTAFAPLAAEPFAVLLDGAAPGPQGRWAFVAADPRRTLTVRRGADAPPLAGVRDLLGPRRAPWPGPGPFAGGAIGFLGYELGGAFERLPPPRPAWFPAETAFGLYDTFAVFDLIARRAWVVDATGDADAARCFAARLGSGAQPARHFAPVRWSAMSGPADYRAKIGRIVDDIRAGDIFQANLTQQWRADWPAGLAPFDAYRALRAAAPGPFAAFMALPDNAAILTVSPERFLTVDAGGVVETRPIKGTRPRGRDAAEDAALARDLLASAKDRAENLMIVDLLRNDLSRVCAAGSVTVPQLCGLETFAAVHHLVSVVTGRLRPGRDALDLLAACFPGGSVTGAPKIRAMEIIAELEPVARGPYCGALAWLGYDGAMDSAILIRTLIKSGALAVAQAGGGIVADSIAADEYQEVLTKARPLLAALGGMATDFVD